MRVITECLNFKIFRFLLVGGSATLIQFTLLFLFIEQLNSDKIFAAVAAYSLSTVYNYGMSYVCVFVSTSKHSSAFPKFLLIAVLGLIFNTIIFWVFSEYLKTNYLIAQSIATCCVLSWNFVMHNFWSFNDNRINHN